MKDSWLGVKLLRRGLWPRVWVMAWFDLAETVITLLTFGAIHVSLGLWIRSVYTHRDIAEQERKRKVVAR